MGFLFGTSPAARRQAEATEKAAADTANNDRLVAQAAAQSRETINAQDIASRNAAELLAKPQGVADVSVAPEGADIAVDATTGRRKTVRSTYSSNTAASGIRI